MPVPANGIGAPRPGILLCWTPIPNFAENFPNEAQIAVLPKAAAGRCPASARSPVLLPGAWLWGV